jgi:outer membrane protein assembly factor BamA
MNKLVSIVLFLGLIFSLENVGFGQVNFKLSINLDSYEVLKYDSVHLDSLSLFNEIEKNHTVFKAKGYLSSYYKTIKLSDSSFSCNYILGELYSWKNLIVSPLIMKINANSEEFRSGPIKERRLEREINYLLSQCQNRGYPFAQVYFDSVTINKGEVSAKLNLNLNNFIIIDSIIVKGGMKTSLNFVEKQIGISKGETYNEKKIKDINKKIGNIGFVEIIRSPEVYFTPGKATLVLYLKDKTASRFDGILGLNPDEFTGKIGVVGNLKVDLLNSFKKGENIILNWEQAKTQSQNYLIRFSYPFLFNTRLGLETGLNYYRQDTSFANLDADFGFSYFLDEKQKVGVSAQFIESNSLLNSQSTLLGLPSINSISIIYYGVNYTYNSLDYRLNPKQQWQSY